MHKCRTRARLRKALYDCSHGNPRCRRIGYPGSYSLIKGVGNVLGEIRLTAESIHYIALFENMTRAKILDCILEEERLVYVVKQGDMGLAIGKNGESINRVKKVLDKPIEPVSYTHLTLTTNREV